jgi:hypothetical protein
MSSVVEGSLSSDDTHTPLSLVLFKTKKIEHPPSDLLNMVSKWLFETLTLRSLLHLCTACRMPPTPPMLAIALQNSIPSLTGLPMDNPDSGFYIDIAKRYFDQTSIPVHRRTHLNTLLQPGRFLRSFIYRGDVEAKYGIFSSGIAYYIHAVLQNCDIIHTKRGRDFIKGVVLEQLSTPIAPVAVKIYNSLLNVLDHGHVLSKRMLVPGRIGQTRIREQDEHL